MDSVSIEIVLKNHSPISSTQVISAAHNYFYKYDIKPNTILSSFNRDQSVLYEHVQYIIVGDVNVTDLDHNNARISWYVYSLDPQKPRMEVDEDSSGSEITLATHYMLPCADFYNLWENLFYDHNIKENLLKYATTIMKFADRGIDPNVVSCNRVILLHGPPGTGKTSLCKALAHKLSIRLRERYANSILIEINSHNLFSKWFSESGKLVAKMFAKIKDVTENSNNLVCVLIDEIESLAHARNKCLSGNEPSDSIKVVNAVLTQIDQIKHYPNVLFLTTSNMTGAIDLAFIDRADVKQFLDFPSIKAIYKIYYSCIQELLRVGLISGKDFILPVTVLDNLQMDETRNSDAQVHSRKLIDICRNSTGLSGRSLRKIPFLAHALFLKNKRIHSMDEFLTAMERAIDHEKSERLHFVVKK